MAFFSTPLAAPLAKPRTRLTWGLLIVPPLLFLLLIVLASVWFGAQGVSPALIPAQVQRATPVLLVAAQILLLGLLLLAMRWQGISLQMLGWTRPQAGVWQRDVALGGGVGAMLGVVYVFVLSPLLTEIQVRFGDYVPPGETLSTLGSALLPFFIANVVLAPFVEETLYRGFAYTQLRQRYSRATAVIIVTLFFGFLHWMGGIWYIGLTAVVAGGTFMALRLRQGTLLAPFAAHLALNLVEFTLIALRYN